jgi:4-amino-4-deoxy-L-arabinose transferase-like glycosyltransferase
MGARRERVGNLDSWRVFGGGLVAIALAGAVLRLVYVLVLARHVPDIGDALFFHGQADAIATGHGFVDPYALVRYGRDIPSASHPPLYPLAMSLVALLHGTGELAQRSVGALFGFGTILLIGLIARRLASPRAGLIAAAVAAVYPVLVAADGAMMSETLYGLLFAATLLVSLRLLDREPRPALGAALGALIGLATLTRAEALLLLPFLAWPIAIRARAGRPLQLAACTAACLVVISPWVIRNAGTFHELALAHNEATVLAGANCHRTYHGVDLGAWNFYCISRRRTLDEGRQSARWQREGLRYVGDHAGRLAIVVPVRVMRTWDFWQPKRQVIFAESEARWATKAGVAAYYVLLPLAIAGAWLIRRRRAELLVMLAPVVLVTIVSAIGYGVPRFRHPAEITIVALAAVTLDRLPGLVRGLRRRRAGRGSASR